MAIVASVLVAVALQGVFWLCGKHIFGEMIAPLAPSLPPLGAGAHVMPRYHLYKDLSAFL
jgi:hypothetical protein